MNPVIGKTTEGRKVEVDPKALIAGHLLIQASSGGGKSYLIRKILEETFGLFPQIVIDVEGELGSLREKFDYIIAGAEGADCLAHPRTAKLLARRLMELNASCIIDIYELKPFEKPLFVQEFVNALLHAPKSLWAPRLIVIDEAHLFAPEGDKKGQVSAAAVCDLMGRGRKRGLSVVLATQRLSKLRKDAAGECRNKLVGFCNLLSDRKRAADDLGFMGKEGLERLRQLDTGQFFAVGPAISKRDVIQIQIGKVQTTHPEPGQGLQAALPPPKEKVRKLLNELKDLPQQAQEEARTLAEAQARIKDLERQLRAPTAQPAPAKGPSKAELEAMGKQAIKKAREALQAHVDRLHEEAEVGNRGYGVIQRDVKTATDHIIAQLTDLSERVRETSKKCQVKLPKRLPTKGMFKEGPGAEKAQKELAQIGGDYVRQKMGDARPSLAGFDQLIGTRTGRISTTTPNISNPPKAYQMDGSTETDDERLGGGARRLVDVLVRCHPAAFTKAQWASLADLSHTSGTFGTYLSKIRAMGLVSEDRGLFRPTEAAFQLCSANVMQPQTNSEVVDMWKRALGGTPAKMIDVVRNAFPEHVTRADLAQAVGITHTSGTFGTYFSKLRSNGLVEVNGETVRAGDPLLWEPGRIGHGG
jgi:DNA segregation ATPase FtsK/SpoIIIE-like protein